MGQRILSIVTAFSVVLTIAGPGVAQAQTAAELQAMIANLTSQLATLQTQLNASTGGSAGSGTGACAGITFSRGLTVGSRGNDVKCLQTLLNSNASTMIASSGAGSPGNETTYFGVRTKTAVKKLQTNNGVRATGFVGPLTRAVLNAMLSTGGTPTPTPTPTGTGTPTPTPPPSGSGLTVTLAADTPAAGNTLVAGQGAADLGHFTFANGDNAAVKVTSFAVNRLGVSADATLSNVYLFQGSTRLTDAAGVASGVINFNDPSGVFTIPAGGVVTVRLVADIASTVSGSSTSGQTVGTGIGAATSITSNASNVNGTFPINSNLQSIASGANLATVVLSNVLPSAASVDPQTGFAVWQGTFTVSNRAVTFNRFALREIGSVLYTDLNNFKLLVDGTQVGSTVANLDANGYVTFDLSAAPSTIQTGARTIKVLADIVGGSNRNFQFSLRVAADANFKDTQYGVYVSPTISGSGSFPSNAGQMSVNAGTITFQKTADSASGNIVNNAANASLAKFTLKAAGERVKIQQLSFTALVKNSAGTTRTDVGALRNGAVYANGVQIGSTTDMATSGASTTTTTYNLGSALVVDPATPVTLEVRADIYDNAAGSAGGSAGALVSGDTIQVQVNTGSSNGQGMVSLQTSNVPSANQTGNQLTVSVGALTLAKYTAYPDQAMVPPLTAAKLGHFTLTSNTTEAVNLNTIEVDIATVSPSKLNNLYVVYGTSTTPIKATVSSANTWSINYTLAVGQTIDVKVYADVQSTATGTGRTDVLITGTTASSATAVNTNTNTVLAGQTITFGSGTLTGALAPDTPLAQAVSGNQTVVAAKYKFTAANDSFTIQEVRIKVAASTSGAVTNLSVLDGSTVVGGPATFQETSGRVSYITGLNVAVPANTVKELTVQYNLSNAVSSDYANDGVNLATTLDWFKYANSQGVQSTFGTAGTDDANDITGNNLYVFHSIPTVTRVALTPATIYNGTQTSLYSWTIKADNAGPISVKQIKLNITWTDNSGSSHPTFGLSTLKLFRGSQDITSLVSFYDNAVGTSVTTVTQAATTLVITWNSTSTSEEAIGAGQQVTYTLKGTPQGLAQTANLPGAMSIAISMPTDSTVVTANYLNAGTTTTNIVKLYTSATTGNASATSANFIWSDYSAVSPTAHSAAVGASSTGDWNNGLNSLLLNLPLDGQSWSGP